MPIYEYKCRACGHEFEAIQLPWSKSAAACPSCKSQDLEQLLSAFAVNSQEKSQATFQAERKHFQKTELRDKRMAEIEEDRHHHDH